jgi:hypothetical protein
LKRILAKLPAECVNIPDTAGRTVLHWAVAHEMTGAVKELLESGKVRPGDTFQTAYIEDITAFHLIILYDHMLPRFYFEYLKDEMETDFCKFQIDFFPVTGLIPGAIQMGRNKFVKQVMETEVICSHHCTSLTLTADLFDCGTNFKS